MHFDLDHATAILSRTPAALHALLEGLPPDWTHRNEGGQTWSPFDVLGHLIHGERADWILRARMILDTGEGRAFPPFDRFAQFRESEGRTLAALLTEFEELRAANLATLQSLKLTPADLAKTGTHPDFGRVALGELLATWVVHDLGHLAQITRTMARQYEAEVGPWRAYLPVLR